MDPTTNDLLRLKQVIEAAENCISLGGVHIDFCNNGYTT